jgi:hypothetical protein
VSCGTNPNDRIALISDWWKNLDPDSRRKYKKGYCTRGHGKGLRDEANQTQEEVTAEHNEKVKQVLRHGAERLMTQIPVPRTVKSSCNKNTREMRRNMWHLEIKTWWLDNV